MGTADEWPRFTTNLERARAISKNVSEFERRDNVQEHDSSLATQVERLSEKLQDLTATVHNRSGEDPLQPPPIPGDLEKEIRWMKVRVMSLEQALEESRAEAKTLAEYLELCFDVMKSQDDRLTQRQKVVEDEVDRLLSLTSRHDRDLFDLRSTQNASSERTEQLTAELLELAHQTSLLAAQAKESASLTAEESEQLSIELRDANRAAQLLASQAQESATLTAAESEHLATELREAIESAQTLANKAQQTADLTADGSQQLALELREANRTAKELATQAKQTADLAAEEIALELREAIEAARALATQAQETANLTAEESVTVAEELREATRTAQTLATQAQETANLTAEEADQIAQELREANRTAKELAAQAKETAELTAEEADQVAQELREASEEARVMAEKAKDRADFSADSVAGLQVDFEEETSALRKRLQDAATHAELDEIERSRQAELQRTTELLEATKSSLDEASTRINKLEDAPRESAEGIATALREEIERELVALRAKMNIAEPASVDEAVEPVKRWRYHLPEEAKSTKTTKALPAGSNDHEPSDQT